MLILSQRVRRSGKPTFLSRPCTSPTQKLSRFEPHKQSEIPLRQDVRLHEVFIAPIFRPFPNFGCRLDQALFAVALDATRVDHLADHWNVLHLECENVDFATVFHEELKVHAEVDAHMANASDG